MLFKKITALASAAAIVLSTLCFSAADVSAASPEEDFVVSNNILTDYSGNGGDIVIPEGVVKIDGLAFQKNDNITSLVIPKGCTKIDFSAFYECTALKTVTFEGDMEAVGMMSFCGCTSLERVTFKGSVIDDNPNDIESGLSFNAFMGCKNLKTVEFEPNSRVDTIKRAAFMDCANLSEVKLPKKVGKICEFAFTNCPKLTRLEIPSKTELEPFAVGYMYDELTDESVKADGIATVQACLDFDDDEFTLEEVCQKPITLIVSPNSPAEKYAEENGIDYECRAVDENDGFIIETIGTAKRITGYTGKGGDIVIPEGVAEIGKDAFKGNESITSVTFPKGFDRMDYAAFNGCEGIKYIIFEGDIEKIGDYAFSGCYALKKVTFKGNVFSSHTDEEGGIGKNAFRNCHRLKTVEFPENGRLDAVGDGAFRDCLELTDVKLPGYTGRICEQAFISCTALKRLEIPSMTELEAFSVGYNDSFNLLGGIERVPTDIVLIVSPDSPAEKYAKENGIAYEYKATAAAPDSGSTESPKTGGESALPLFAAVALSLTVMIFTRAKKV